MIDTFECKHCRETLKEFNRKVAENDHTDGIPAIVMRADIHEDGVLMGFHIEEHSRAVLQLIEAMDGMNSDHTEVVYEGGNLPNCDICGKEAHYDAKTRMGPWAYVCEEHFFTERCQLGLGLGQRLLKLNQKE